ncbi:MAG: hypothetical protein HDQ96_13820 [Lachnospiraceae bacterium]|nr:hypothetical protein [Lachnospiraceae bacterium]
MEQVIEGTEGHNSLPKDASADTGKLLSDVFERMNYACAACIIGYTTIYKQQGEYLNDGKRN